MSGNNFEQVVAENLSATGASASINADGDQFSVQVVGGTSSGSGAATVDVEVSNVPNPTVDGHWSVAGTITLTLGTDITSDALALVVPYKRIRVNVTAISGTGAKVSAYGCGG